MRIIKMWHLLRVNIPCSLSSSLYWNGDILDVSLSWSVLCGSNLIYQSSAQGWHRELEHSQSVGWLSGSAGNRFIPSCFISTLWITPANSHIALFADLKPSGKKTSRSFSCQWREVSSPSFYTTDVLRPNKSLILNKS